MTLTGIDVSHWDGLMDYSKTKKAGISFVIFKATDFNSATKIGFTDTQLANNWNGSRAEQIINGCYHWLQPKVNPAAQADFFLKAWDKYPCGLAPVLDFEDQNFSSNTEMLYNAQVWLDRVESATGRLPIVYTSSGYMRQFEQSKTGFLFRYPLWLAQYTSWPIPSVPKPWATWTFWQYSDKGNGPTYGASSASLDLNRFNGALDDLQKLATNATPGGKIVEEVIGPSLGICKARVISYSLNVRSGPGLSFPAVSALKAGDVVDVLNFDGSNAWLQIGAGQYIAYRMNGAPYLEMLR